MTYAVRPNSSHILAKHYDNQMALLEHRLEVARAARNFYLVEQLEREKQQINANAPHAKVSRSLTQWLKATQERITRFLLSQSELKVHEFLSGTDHWWYAFDPNTGRCIYADSEAELRLWIKENYQGR